MRMALARPITAVVQIPFILINSRINADKSVIDRLINVYSIHVAA